MATKEAKSSHAVRERSSAWGARLFRNNSGALPNPDTGIPVRFGLGNESKEINKELKSGDLIGYLPVTITPEMVGKTIPVFTNFECKASDFVEKKFYNKNQREYGQNNFNKMVIAAGGIAGFVWNIPSVDKVINDFLSRMKQ